MIHFGPKSHTFLSKISIILIKNLIHFRRKLHTFWSKILYFGQISTFCTFWSKILYFGQISNILFKNLVSRTFIHFGQKSYTFCSKISYILDQNLQNESNRWEAGYLEITPYKNEHFEKKMSQELEAPALLDSCSPWDAKVALKSDFISHVKPF